METSQEEGGAASHPGADQRPARILVVDDEPQILRALRASLTAAGYDVVTASGGAEALESAALRPPDAIVLDVRLPDRDGIEVCSSLREWTEVPVLIVSALHGEDEKIAALDAGADDYVTKPYAVGELLARLRAALRRAEGRPAEAPPLVFGEIEVDLARRAVLRAGARVHLTPHEYELLATLARNPGRVMTHRTLLRAAWGPRYTDEIHYVRVYMAALRRKLERDPAQPRHLLTETGVGYRLEIDEPAGASQAPAQT
jgi:two-component system KDP operon response regulator KdpE